MRKKVRILREKLVRSGTVRIVRKNSDQILACGFALVNSLLPCLSINILYEGTKITYFLYSPEIPNA